MEDLIAVEYVVVEEELQWQRKIAGVRETPCWVVLANKVLNDEEEQNANPELFSFFINQNLHNMIELADQDEEIVVKKQAE